ncbi:MAG: hypothetical protein HUJ83_01890 [Veillonella sp.]|uniref:hypothetical protein n=1 Tax=Veillonella caviae TaxID=248316 RepID=UPI000F8DCE43|nr:hypothetical protein [Veillonella caviae]MCF0157251.1 hypothetical protein [Veillonella sp.]
MKQYTVLVTAILLSLCMPTAMAERDVLLEANPATAVVGTNDYLMQAVRPETADMIHQFAQQWSNARAAVALAESHRQSGELTKEDLAWLEITKEDKMKNHRHSYAALLENHLLGRVHFYERSHNWNGENENDNEYRYFTYPGAHNQGTDKYTNSYGFNVLRTMADTMSNSIYEVEQSGLVGADFVNEVETRMISIMEKTQSTVQNDELRYYVNQTVWFATKQTIKERMNREPSTPVNKEVNLKRDIQK